MDDIVILAPSRWALRRAIATMKHHFHQLGLELHPDKTSMGPVSRGFDCLGYHFATDGIRLSSVALERHQAKLHRLYERCLRQRRKGRMTMEQADAAITTYLRRFRAWAFGGLDYVRLEETFAGGGCRW